MRLPWFIALVVLALLTGHAAEPAAIPEAETFSPPTSARLAALTRLAAPDRWRPVVPVLQAAARSAYEHEKLVAASAWLNAARWAALFAQTEAEFVPGWIKTIENTNAGHPNMPSRFAINPLPMGRLLAADLQGWLLGDTAFSEEFFSLLTPQDYVPEVFRILDALHRGTPDKFVRYASLALAIAVVYDVPPPPWWPHAQVAVTALPRRLPAPAEAFAWWTKEDAAGRTFHRLTRLPAEELKFVVDAAAPFDQLVWAQKNTGYPLGQLDRVYSTIRYRHDRIAENRPIWPGTAYSLPVILREGGICVDQAYFASEAGKARGVPTLLFGGAGGDARHAWFGFLDGTQKWQLDAGRGAEQRFVTGLAIDPQTWRQISDHELKFLSERFRALPPYRQSQIHGAFAVDYLATGAHAAAARAARAAVTTERRNLPAWETLLAAEVALGRTARQREATLREAAIAFQAYPDLEAFFVNRVSASLRARGETSAAEAEESAIARKNQVKRGDLSTQQAWERLRRSMATDKLPIQIQTFTAVLDGLGRGAGIGFFDEVVVPFVEHLARAGEKTAAERAIQRARQTLKVEPNSQLDGELTALLKKVTAKKP